MLRLLIFLQFFTQGFGSTQGGAVDITTGHYENVVTLYNNIVWDNPTTVHLNDDSDIFIDGDSNASVTVRYNDFLAGNIFNGASSSKAASPACSDSLTAATSFSRSASMPGPRSR